MPEKEDRALLLYEWSSAGTRLATVLCGIALVMRPALLGWATGLFLLLGGAAAVLAAYLLVRHAYHEPRFKVATLLVWTAVTVFVMALLWVRYGTA
jgi:hypothetical protein